MVFEAITALVLTYQTFGPEYLHNSRYISFPDSTTNTIVVQDTQTGKFSRCTQNFECSEWVDFKPKPKE